MWPPVHLCVGAVCLCVLVVCVGCMYASVCLCACVIVCVCERGKEKSRVCDVDPP